MRRRSSWADATSSRRRASRPTARSSRGSRGICRTCRGTAPSCGSRISTRAEPCPASASSPGRPATESIFQPEWGPDGVLHFVSDRTDWWNLYREVDGEVRAICPMDAEFGWPQWVFGVSTYAFLDDGRIACIWTRNGTQHVSVIDPRTGELLDLDLPYDAIDFPFIAAEGQTIAFVGGSADTPPQVVVLDFLARSVDVLKESDDDHGRTGVPVRPPGDRVPDGRRSHRARVLLPAGEQGLRRTGRRAAAADRDEPRRSHVGRLRRVRHGDAVLDQPRVRGRRRELRREHRLRAGVSRAAERELGRGRHDGLHQRGHGTWRTRARSTASGS